MDRRWTADGRQMNGEQMGDGRWMYSLCLAGFVGLVGTPAEMGNVISDFDDVVVEMGIVILDFDDVVAEMGIIILDFDDVVAEIGNVILDFDDVVAKMGIVISDFNDVVVKLGNAISDFDDVIVELELELANSDPQLTSATIIAFGSAIMGMFLNFAISIENWPRPACRASKSGCMLPWCKKETWCKTEKWVFFLRIAQVVFALLILALAAASEHSLRAWTSVTGSFSFMIFLTWSLGFILFVSVATVLGIAYFVIVPIFASFLYNCWVVFVLETLAVFAWSIVFVIMTAWASANTAAKLYNSANGLGSVLYAGPGKDDYYGMKVLS
ncbi:MAG: hypothetical protein M1840_009010 [Geoglossum simile]|nr:MAG: hypothetical protein M1840_009010 [Geoglossum simile]